MSTFDGQDLFGSGGHQVIFGQVADDSHEISFAGQNDSFDMSHGTRRAFGQIVGELRGSNYNDLLAQELDIRQYVADGGAYTLVDNFGGTFNSVKLLSYTPRGPRKTTDDDLYLQKYIVRFKWLTPVSND